MNFRHRIFLSLFAAAAIAAAFFYFKPPPTVKPPFNVILVVVDTLAAKHMALYGYHRPTTPHLSEFARDAFLFTAANSASSYTLTSHASIFTGLSVVSHGLSRRYLDDKTPLSHEIKTLPQMLQSLGFSTAWFAITNDDQLPLNRGFERGFDVFMDRPFMDQGFFTAEREKWLDENPGRRKFIFWHSYLPHTPYVPTKEYANRFDPGYKGKMVGNLEEYERRIEESKKKYGPRPELEIFTESFDERDPRDRFHIEALYDAEVLQLDAEFGSLIADLKKRGLYDNSLIVFTSDHGEAFMEHGHWNHHTLHTEITRVPLIIRVPGLKPGRSDLNVEAVDILPTILDVLGEPVPARAEGRSLKPILIGETRPELPFVFSATEKEGPYSARNSRWHLIYDAAGTHELYDVVNDPFEAHDVSGRHPEAAAELIRGIRKYLDERI